MPHTRWTLMALLVITIGGATAQAQETAEVRDGLRLSEDVRSLLQEEMREIAAASQAIVLAFVSGDWAAVKHMSEEISASYVMAKKLTDAQRQELEDKLPEGFKHLDMAFHARAEKLGMAAESGDLEVIAFQFNRLLETCATCHAAYAKSRFPGFVAKAPDVHRH